MWFPEGLENTPFNTIKTCAEMCNCAKTSILTNIHVLKCQNVHVLKGPYAKISRCQNVPVPEKFLC